MSDQPNPRAGLGALLTPDNCVLVLIDHQPFQFAGLRSHDTQTIINNVVGLAKAAKIFGVPTLLTTVLERQGGYILKPLQDLRKVAKVANHPMFIANTPPHKRKNIQRQFTMIWQYVVALATE